MALPIGGTRASLNRKDARRELGQPVGVDLREVSHVEAAGVE